MRSKEETTNPRFTRKKIFHNKDDNEYTSRNDKVEKEVIHDRHDRRLSYDDIMRIFFQIQEFDSKIDRDKEEPFGRSHTSLSHTTMSSSTPHPTTRNARRLTSGILQTTV